MNEASALGRINFLRQRRVTPAGILEKRFAAHRYSPATADSTPSAALGLK